MGMILLSQAVHLEYLGLVLHLDSDENQVAEVEDSVVRAGLILADWADCDCVPVSLFSWVIVIFCVNCHSLRWLMFSEPTPPCWRVMTKLCIYSFQCYMASPPLR